MKENEPDVLSCIGSIVIIALSIWAIAWVAATLVDDHKRILKMEECLGRIESHLNK